MILTPWMFTQQVIYNFMMFLLTYLKQEVNVNEEEADTLTDKTHMPYIFPLCCLKPLEVGRYS